MISTVSEAELYARINFLNDKLKELLVLKADLVDYVIELKFLLKDITEDFKYLARKTLMDCPVWYLRNEKEILGKRADRVSNAFLNGLRQNKEQKFDPKNRSSGFFE